MQTLGRYLPGKLQRLNLRPFIVSQVRQGPCMFSADVATVSCGCCIPGEP